MKILSPSSITPAQIGALQNYALNVLGVSVERIDNTWDCCKYKYRVFVKVHKFYASWHLVPVLNAIFGGATYFWDDCYLCGLKENAKSEHLYNL